LLTAAILAGGRATRFGGRDKSALVVEGRTIFDRQKSELSQIASDILFVGATQPADPPPGVRVIADLMPGCGPLGGLHAALRAARSEVLIVVACDMPYVSAPFLAYLASLAGEPANSVAPGGPDAFVAVVPRTERGYHPLCAAYTRAAIAPIERRLGEGRLTMTDLLTDVRLRVVAADEIARFGDPHQLLANVNTPAEHRSLEALHNHEV
jgi:molybdopterin-guanine dinucleotide biosynthesis protein A